MTYSFEHVYEKSKVKTRTADYIDPSELSHLNLHCLLTLSVILRRLDIPPSFTREIIFLVCIPSSF